MYGNDEEIKNEEDAPDKNVKIMKLKLFKFWPKKETR
jgi:hypothetical protein